MDLIIEKLDDLINYVNYRIGEVSKEERVELTYLLVSMFLLKTSYQHQMLSTTVSNFTNQYNVMIAKLSELLRDQIGTFTPTEEVEIDKYLRDEFPDLFNPN